MAKIPTRVNNRLVSGLKKFQPILESARDRDLNESDTSIIITDFLAEVLGYDKYTEITSEFAIRGTYCDLALKLDGKLQMLIEVKAAGLELKDAHVKQAVDYAANQGVEWVTLTNGCVWKVFKIAFTKPIDKEEIVELDMTKISAKSAGPIEKLYLLAKEGFTKSALADYYTQRQAVNRQTVAAVLLHESVLKVARRELDRLAPEVRVQLEDVEKILRNEVLKRDLTGDKETESVIKKVHRSLDKAKVKKPARQKTKSAALSL